MYCQNLTKVMGIICPFDSFFLLTHIQTFRRNVGLIHKQILTDSRKFHAATVPINVYVLKILASITSEFLRNMNSDS